MKELILGKLFSRTHSDLFSIYSMLHFLFLLSKYVPYKSCFPYLILVANLYCSIE